MPFFHLPFPPSSYLNAYMIAGRAAAILCLWGGTESSRTELWRSGCLMISCSHHKNSELLICIMGVGEKKSLPCTSHYYFASISLVTKHNYWTALVTSSFFFFLSVLLPHTLPSASLQGCSSHTNLIKTFCCSEVSSGFPAFSDKIHTL